MCQKGVPRTKLTGERKINEVCSSAKCNNAAFSLWTIWKCENGLKTDCKALRECGNFYSVWVWESLLLFPKEK